MSALALVLIIVGAVLLVLFAGGAIAVARRNARHRKHLAERVTRADLALASAYAEDKGWEREALEQAARAAFREEYPGEEPGDVALVGVVDLPGTEEDLAVFEVRTHGHAHRLTLGRRGGEWHRRAEGDPAAGA